MHQPISQVERILAELPGLLQHPDVRSEFAQELLGILNSTRERAITTTSETSETNNTTPHITNAEQVRKAVSMLRELNTLRDFRFERADDAPTNIPDDQLLMNDLVQTLSKDFGRYENGDSKGGFEWKARLVRDGREWKYRLELSLFPNTQLADLPAGTTRWFRQTSDSRGIFVKECTSPAVFFADPKTTSRQFELTRDQISVSLIPQESAQVIMTGVTKEEKMRQEQQRDQQQ